MDSFECYTEPIEVTSMSRPDPGWRFVDSHGHEHRWFVDGQPATRYEPLLKFELPTLIVVAEDPVVDEWGDEWTPRHHECRECGEVIEPGHTADTYRQYIPGMKYFRINGNSVSPDEYERRLKEQHPDA